MNTAAAQKRTMLPTPKVVARLVALQPWSFTIHSLFTLVVFALQIVPGLIVKTVFDTISGAAPPPQSRFGLDPLVWMIVLYVGIELVRLGVSFGSEWYGWTFRLMTGSLIRSNVFASILRRKADQPLPLSSGEVVHRLDDDVGEITDFPTWLPDQLGKWIAAVIAVIIMGKINLPITLVIFLPLVGTILLTRFAWGNYLVYDKLAAEAGDKVAGFMGEAFGSVQSIKVADAEGSTARHLQGLNEKRAEIELRLHLYVGMLESISNSVVTFGIGVVLLMAGTAIAGGNFSVGDFALFVSYLWFTTHVPGELGTFYGDYKTQAVSIDRLLEMVRPENPEKLLEVHPVYEKGDLPDVIYPEKNMRDRLNTLDVVGLSYQHHGNGSHDPEENGHNGAARAGIENISFSLRRGEFVVVTGRVGSGKSTLMRTLLGLLPRQGGEVRWNGLLINDLAEFMRPPRAVYTAQVPRLFSETLRENILMGLEAGPEDLDQAIQRSVFEEDIEALSDGLNTLVGPRGIRLSGGQVQRVAAARSFVRKPELLLFDDLSSALDVHTERALWERLSLARQAGEEVTCLVISHRKPALVRADRILLMKNGRLHAAGTLDELLATNSEMQYLWTGIEGEEDQPFTANQSPL